MEGKNVQGQNDKRKDYTLHQKAQLLFLFFSFNY